MSKKSRRNLLGAIFRKIDLYGHPITLKYQKSSTYKTIFGGVVTLISGIVITAFFALQVLDVV